MAMSELILESVIAGYAGTTVLEGVSMRIREGECVGIIGRNGAGKTTTLATALGLTQQKGGCVSFNGIDISTKPT